MAASLTDAKFYFVELIVGEICPSEFYDEDTARDVTTEIVRYLTDAGDPPALPTVAFVTAFLASFNEIFRVVFDLAPELLNTDGIRGRLTKLRTMSTARAALYGQAN